MVTKAYFNGQIGNFDEMVIPLSDRSVFFGDAVYDAVLVLGGKPFALELHLDRLYNSCALTDIAFDMPREQAQEIFDARLSALWLSFDAYVIFTGDARCCAPQARISRGGSPQSDHVCKAGRGSSQG